MRRQLLLAGLVLAGALTPAGAASAADGEGTGIVALEPASGSTDGGKVMLLTSRPCAEGATNVLVRISGAGFPEGSNAVGNSELAILPSAPASSGVVIPLFGSWDVVAQSNGATEALDGAARMTLVCTDALGSRIYEEMTGAVEFTRQDGAASRYEQVGGPALVSGVLPALPPEDGYDNPAPPASGGDRAPQLEPAVGDVPAAAQDSRPTAEELPQAAADPREGVEVASGVIVEPDAVQTPGVTEHASGSAGGSSAPAVLFGAGVFIAVAATGVAGYVRATRVTHAPPPT